MDDHGLGADGREGSALGQRARGRARPRASDTKPARRNVCRVVREEHVEGSSLLFALQFRCILKFLPSGTFMPDIPVLDRRTQIRVLIAETQNRGLEQEGEKWVIFK